VNLAEGFRRVPLWLKIVAVLVVFWALGVASATVADLGGSAPPERGTGVTIQTP
jgi:hypothetical protein